MLKIQATELWLVSNFNFVEIFLFWVELPDNVNKIMSMETHVANLS